MRKASRACKCSELCDNVENVGKPTIIGNELVFKTLRGVMTAHLAKKHIPVVGLRLVPSGCGGSGGGGLSATRPTEVECAETFFRSYSESFVVYIHLFFPHFKKVQ